MRPGETIDRYRIDAPLGEGGMGRVYRATHIQLGSPVAIKVLKAEAANVPELSKRFIREARAASKLRGEHVCKVTDVGQTSTGQPYMVMELLEGYDVATLIKNGPVAIDVAARIISQACAGLAEAHAMGMVHRDIKPANLFVAQTPQGPSVKILDFGIATAAQSDVGDGRLTRTESVMGSPSYMSPEQLRSARDVDARSDIWSLGVSLYEMISGDLPFKNATFSGLAISVATEAHLSISSRFLGIGTVIDRCLEKRPQDRMATVADLAAALSPFFVEGVPWAVRVQRVLDRPVEVTQIGDDPARSATLPPVVVPASTTNFTSGESIARVPPRRKKWPWLAGGSVALGGGIALVIALSGNGPTAAAGSGTHPAVGSGSAVGSAAGSGSGSGNVVVEPIGSAAPAAGSGSAVAAGSGSGSGSGAATEIDMDGSGSGSAEVVTKPAEHHAPPHHNPPAQHHNGNPTNQQTKKQPPTPLNGSDTPYDHAPPPPPPPPPDTHKPPPDTHKQPCRPDDPTCGL